jgi:dihydroorotate dehydrogenase
MYRILFAVLLRRVPAEAVHRLSFRTLRLLTVVPGAVPLLRRLLAPRDPVLRVEALGLEFPSPLGLAAGFDKDAEAYDALGAFGFGFVEVGTVTARPQPGNPRPRLFRLVADRAIINRMGFNNHGAGAAAKRLDRPRTGLVVGVNIGKTKVVPEGEAIADYVASTERLAPLADYLVVNVSSPNTPGLRNLQAVEHLRPLLLAVREATDRVVRRPVPLLVKIAPDLADADIDAVADLALEIGLDGIIATNTTISRDGLSGDPAAAEAGGLSGPPLKRRALEVLERLHGRTGDRLVLISVGGIETADEAYERLRAGATLVQAYTGLVYGGPTWPRKINRGLAERLRHEASMSSSSPLNP